MASIEVVAPRADARVSGAVELRARITGGGQASRVAFVVGAAEHGTLPAVPLGAGEYGATWDSTVKLVDRSTPTPGDALYWVTARASVDGVDLTAPYVPLVTANRPVDGLPAGGWRPELAWEADYDGTLEDYARSHSAVIGLAHASLEDDPTGRPRRVLRASVPDSAADDADQPTEGTVRFQAAGRRAIVEGDELCVGWSFLLGDDFPTVHPADDPANPDGPRGTGYVALFQLYGPPYTQGSPLVLHADRRSPAEPLDELVIRGNELNPGDPFPLLAIPYRRGRWTDVVLRLRASRSIESGWIEAYVNQGEAGAVRPVPFVGGLLRVPRVLLRADSEPFRTDMQVYRVAGRLERVTVWHTAHRVARTVAAADPRTYRPDWGTL